MLSSLTGLLFLSGAGMFAYPFFTDIYTNQFLQKSLEEEFDAITVDSFEEWEAQVSNQQGMALTKIVIPAIGVETLVVEGTSPDALRAGAGHYPNTPLPGQNGNVAIAGHRTTYGKPFNQIDVLDAGDTIWLITPVGDYRYTVVKYPDSWTDLDGQAGYPYITRPTDWDVIAPTAVPSLTLTSCHPKGSARERIIVRAELTEKLPPGSWESQQSTPA
ncbi:MAG: class E sortase [Nitriliruptorales bacterium]|nr:class E sortase [Nitriliruptorales bacterium]